MRNPDLLEQSIITNLIFFTMGCKIKIMEEISRVRVKERLLGGTP